MKTTIIKAVTFMLIALSGLSKVNGQTCKEIVGYYPNWQWYDRSKLVNPLTIDYNKYSILNYCFFKPEPDGSIIGTDSWADENLLLGEMDWGQGVRDFSTSIVYNAHLNNVEILPSIGGWTLSDNFPSIAADPVKRANFAQACVNLIQLYDFDGIDLDWEYPGYAAHSGTPQDISNFTLLLQEIRTAIDTYGQSINKPMLLTIAVGAAPDKMDDVQWTAVANIVDIINLMSYDFFGAWDPITNHNAPLYAPELGNPEYNLHNSVQRLLNTYNVDPQKITIGIAFYGRSVTTNTTPDLHMNSTGIQDLSTFGMDVGTPLYYNILNNMNLFSYHWDSVAKVPYLLGNGSLNTFLSYDDEKSIGLKAEYIIDNDLRGAIIWEITGDYIETTEGSGVISGTPLVDTLNSVFCNYTGQNNLNITIAGTDTICVDDNIMLSANGANSYLWNTGQSTSDIWVSPLVTTTYSVQGTSNGVSVSENYTVVVVQVPTLPIITQNGTDLETGNASNYQWSLNGLEIFGANSQSFEPIHTGNYTVEIFNEQGCSAISVSFFWEPVFPNVVVTGPDTICLGETVTLTASGADTYLWNSGAITPAIGVSPNVSTVYSVAGTIGSTDVTVSHTLVVVNLPSVPIIFENGYLLETGLANSYQWFLNGVSLTGFNQYYEPVLEGVYTVEVFNTFGCSTISSGYYWAPLLPEITITGEDTICLGDSVQLTVSGTDEYLWSTGDTTESIVVFPSQLTTYSVTGSNYYGSVTESHSVEVLNVPMPAIIENFDDELQTIQTYSSYQWYVDGVIIVDSINQSIYPNLDGDYLVEVTNEYGCVGISEPYNWGMETPGSISENSDLFTFFPNPSNGRIIIDNESESVFYAKLISLEGKLVQNFGRQEGHKVELRIMSVSSGFYYLMILNQENSFVLPLMLE